MLKRFCKLCYQAVDESVVYTRRFSVEYSRKISSETYKDDENKHEQENFDNIEESEEKPEKKKKFCIIKCKRSSFNFYKGDTFPKFKPIPLASGAWQHRKSKDDYFTIFPTELYPEDQLDRSIHFRDLNLKKELLDNLEHNQIIHPTPIQKLAIPILLKGQNAVLTAETGSGKTYAYLIPILQQILEWKSLKPRDFNEPLGIIVTPSRELTEQITIVAKKLARNVGIKISSLTGGKTKKLISDPPVSEIDLMIATLGVINKLSGIGIYKLGEVRHVVLDEADTLFDETFSETTAKVLKKIPIDTERKYDEGGYPTSAQLTLNSATVPQSLDDTLYQIIDPNSLQPVVTGNEHLVRVPQKFWRVIGSEKPQLMLKLVKAKAKSKTPIIIFSNTSATCDFTKLFLEQFNINCVNLHGGMSLKIRRGKFMEFRKGHCNVLTTTDAGARGLDTVMAKNVINYDFPLETSEYIHRCGRIGRIGSPKDCTVINFISQPLEIIIAKKIEFATRKMKPIPMVDLFHDKNRENQFLTHTPNDYDIDQEDKEDNGESNREFSYEIPQ